MTIDHVIDAALKAGRAIMQIYTHPDLDWQVERKADNSPLTIADRSSHEVIAEALSASPYPLLSEEGAHLPYEERRTWHSLWIVDPLDGTKEFLKKNDEFTVNIALVTDGVPVLGVIYVPARYRLYWGSKGEGAYTATVDPETYTVGQAERLPLKGADLSRPYRVVASRSHLSPETARRTTRMPPAMLRNTSFCASLKPTRFSSTARSMLRRRRSKPVADRCGVP